jgi:hypothetical protein
MSTAFVIPIHISVGGGCQRLEKQGMQKNKNKRTLILALELF